MSRESERSGHWAEEKAARYLESKGYRLIQQRYRCRQGEIDLILEDQGWIVFAEVKYRRSLAYGDPLEFISREKIRKIRACAQWYLRETGTEDLPCRFDVLSLWNEDGRLKVRHIRNAF